jgi:hypothetical protein
MPARLWLAARPGLLSNTVATVAPAVLAFAVAACGLGPPATQPPPATETPALTPVPRPDLSPSRASLLISGLAVTCGPLVEADCREVVAAFGSIARGATEAEVGGPICDGRLCPAPPPDDLTVGVVLRFGEGDLTMLLTCVRPATESTPFTCERAPVDLG